MTFDEWESPHPPMQNESPNAYARRAFNAGVRSRHRIESVGDKQAECAPRYAVRLFKDALIDRFDQYPIPSQLGVTAIMKVIKQFHDGYTTPQECAPREAQPDGWKLVPKEPTQEMIDNTAFFGGIEHARVSYVAMLAAAPTPERAQESAGVRLTPEQSGAIQIAVSILSPEYQLTANRLQSILAAKKEPQP